MAMQRKCSCRACSSAHSTVRSSIASERWNVVSGQRRLLTFSRQSSSVGRHPQPRSKFHRLSVSLSPCFRRLLHVRNGNCKYHLGEETFKLAQSYMEKLAKHGHQANKAALYGELCALLFAKSHYDEVGYPEKTVFCYPERTVTSYTGPDGQMFVF